MIRVIELITSLGEGGAQSLVKDYALSLNNDFEVIIVCIFPLTDSNAGKSVMEHGIPVKCVYPRYSLWWRMVNKLLGKRIVSNYIKRIIRSYHPNVLHAHLGVLEPLALIKSYLPSKLFYTCHSEPYRTFGPKGSPGFVSAKDLLHNTNMQVIALHEKMAEEINKMFGVRNTEVVYNGIDVNRFRNVAESKIEIRTKLNIPQEAYLVGHVGRFISEKNHSFVIEVFAELKKNRPESILLLVGTGPLKAQVKREIENLGLSQDVIFLDHRNDVERILKSLDVFLFPSLKEGFPVALIEAQIAGLHCVVSNCITKEAFISRKLLSLDLSLPINKWVQAVSEIHYCSGKEMPYEMFDMKSSIIKIEQLYKR